MVDGVKLHKFEDLEVWQNAQDLAVEIYKITKTFPSEEKFGLTNQLRRAASSISANIAEGFGRRSKKDKAHFYVIAYGSLLEVKNFILLSQRLDLISNEVLSENLERIESCQRQLNAMIRAVNNRNE